MTDAAKTFDARDERDTQRLGHALAAALESGGIVALDGPLGAGKTRLVQAIAESLGVDRRDVVSPTFVLVHEYHGRRDITHVDAYRLRDADDFLQLGAEDYFSPGSLVLVEWSDMIEDALPADRLEIKIEPSDGSARRFRLAAR